MIGRERSHDLHGFKMACKQNIIRDALNSAKSFNLANVVHEDRLLNLIEEYLMEEEEEEEVESDHELLEESLISRSTQEAEIRGAGLAEEASTSNSGGVVEIESEEESSGDEDFDLVVDLEGNIELDIENVLERDPQLQKIERFVCGCKLKLASGETGCIKQFTADWIFNRRITISELSEEAKNYYIKGLIESPGVADSQMTKQKKASRQTERIRKRRTHLIGGNHVCRSAFLFILCLGKGRLDLIQKMSLDGKAKGKRGGRDRNNKVCTAEETEKMVTFIKSFAEDHGLALPGRVPGYYRAGLKLLLSHWTKVKIWAQYKDASEKTGCRVLSLSTFKRTWLLYVPFIVVARPMSDLCNICQTNNSLILRSANSGDPHKMRLLQERIHHIEQVNKERELYNSYVQSSKKHIFEASIGELQKSTPCTCNIKVMYAFDFAQQVHLPSSPMQPGPIYFLTPRKCGLFGVCCPGIPEQMNFVVDEGMCCGKGSNFVISYVHFFFENYGLGETELVLYCDNCSGQNKNNFMLWYLLWRVSHGYHRHISLNFMVPGHTKFALDWCFGLLKQNFRRSEVHCLQDVYSVIEGSATRLNKAQLVGL
ncbi:hypothetical protein PoB_000749200 [Plakobranchus ocellatus]|uniref:DUF7869 domain-containing protein n=1 Tax=Plakobranchus ocellatus TaxID=259542 RepID=A0AAV3YDM1_9GAST|nr:hypothetical protein PoB_000749200 [Plakobranchus ocellatus]